MMRLLVLGGAVLCLFSLGCSLPPFDDGLSLAMVTADKLDPVTRIGPIQAWHGDFEDGELSFFPIKDAPDSKIGYLLIASSYFLRVRFLNGPTGQFMGELRLDGPAADANQKTYTAEPLKGGPCLSLAVFDPANPNNNALLVLDPAFPSLVRSAVDLKSYFQPSFPVTLVRIVGVHLYPETDPVRDRFAFFGVLDLSGHFGEISRYTDPLLAGGLGAATVPPLNRLDSVLPSLPAPGSGAFYFHRPVAPNTSYLSWYEASTGTYRNYAWDDGLTAGELTGMRRRIDAVLTTGELLSFANGACYVYDGNGSRKYSFPMGSLHFCFEKYDNAAGSYRLYFSLAYWLYGYRNGEDKLLIDIYSLPTASLDSLN
jgi:hypothetical protein